ncbi:MAG: SMP-30/gluconolactonase/LRE family protein [Thermodesulfobacteriota bacterium]
MNKPFFPLLIILAAMILFATTGSSAPVEIKPAWQSVNGFSGPESVVFDPIPRILLVSNGGSGDPLAKDGNGTIAKVALHGVMLDERWVTGLNGPKGMALIGDTLYVADIDELVIIDLRSGQKRHVAAPGARSLNDIALDDQGRVYISDTLSNTIYRYAKGRLKSWLNSPKLAGPNGLLVQGSNLYVASWGEISSSTPGQLLRVSLADKKITPLAGLRGHLDGLAPDHQGGFWVTDFRAGLLLRTDKEGRVRQRLKLGAGCADLAMLPVDWQLLIVPMMNDNRVDGFSVK